MAKNKKRKKKSAIFLLVVSIFLFIAGGFLFIKNKQIFEQKKIREQQIKLEKEIKSHYSNLVVVTKNANLYSYNDDKEYLEVGSIKKDEIITLDNQDITYQVKYFKIKELGNEYYISYQDVIPTEKEVVINDRYKKYIPFNENIVTTDNVNFYNEKEEVVYNIKKSLSLPIIIKYGDTYGVTYNDKLLIVKKEDVKEIVKNNNTNLSGTGEIAVLNYHFFYDDSQESERRECNQIICHPMSKFREHLNYIRDNNVFTPTMKEYELWYDKKINLPKSVVITIDDGWRMQQGIDLLEEYKLNGTVFLITSWFKDKIKFLHDYEYIEFHSHGDNLHNQGECSGGQGGAIKCASKTRLLEDLALSRKKLENNTTYFCYPFYEYNNYSISVLKEAGYTMAFAGAFYRSKQNGNRYAIPRYIMYNNTDVATLKKYIG